MDIKGIFHITGEPDTGKSILALSAYHPKDTAYIFDDVKKPGIESNEFGLYLDLVEKHSKLKTLEFYKAVMDDLGKIPDKKYKSIVFDTWARLGKSIRYYAKVNPKEFREASTFSKKGEIKGMEEWAETNRVESAIISMLSRKCEALFLITHIKPHRKAGSLTGSYEPDCGKSFDKICNMRLWLRHNPNSGIPIALVLKRLTKIELTKKGITPINVLPRKLVPTQSDITIWDIVSRYWDDPVGNREAFEYEIPTSYELSILDGVLTEDQKEIWQAELREKQRQEKKQREVFNLQWNEIKAEAISLRLPAPIALAQLQVEYPDLTLANLQEMLR